MNAIDHPARFPRSNEPPKPALGRVLVCDDEPGVRFALAEVLCGAGYHVTETAGGADAIAVLGQVVSHDGRFAEGHGAGRDMAIDVVVSDLSMPGVDGMQVLAAARSQGLPVVLVTARGSERAAVNAMKSGAFDYLAKPFDVVELVATVERAVETRRMRAELRRVAVERATGRPVIGKSPVMQNLFATIERLADRDVTVLVTGATGTGKELVANLLHGLGRRSAGPFVRFNCAALPADLAESELFGHARGAFTGARDAKPGFFARANGGTLVLDEIGDLPFPIQSKLLRALQDGEIQPVGAGRVDKVDVRVVASTHRDLRAEVAAGRFREDLFYRIAVVEVRVPRLEERRGDIGPLAVHFAARFADRFGLDDVRLSEDLCAELARRSWPGNVRELENTIGRLLALSDGGLIDVTALDVVAQSPTESRPPTSNQSLRQQLDALEHTLVSQALEASLGNKSEAARRLGLSRVTLLDRMKRLSLA